jgi:alpha-tubulin suppressor-like RCC1 family protein
MGRSAVVLALLAACYAPTPTPDVPCSETHRCPEGLTCDRLSDTCVETVPPAATFSTISAGATHTCAIDPDGALWCWGSNERGELGLEGVEDRLVPTRVDNFSDWTAISAGAGATCGLRKDASLWCWGDNTVTGTPQTTPAPTQIIGEWRAVSVGLETMCATTVAGDVSCHDGAPPGFTFTVSGLGATAAATSNHYYCAIDSGQHAVCWGANTFGQLGLGNTDPQPAPMPVMIPSAKVIATGNEHACAIDLDGRLWCWGHCESGEVGPAMPADGVTCATPLNVEPAQRFLAVSAGVGFTCALRDDDVVICFGLGEFGQLGSNGGIRNTLPTPIDALPDGWASVSAGFDHTCAIQRDGATLCWGANTHGQLGDGLGGRVFEPVLVDDGGAWQSVAAGAMGTCGVRVEGTLWCWGRNSSGQLADGTVRPRHFPIQVGEDTDWIAVTVGWDHVCATKRDQSLWCWGGNDQGQLGTGGTASVAIPQHISAAGDGWEDVAAGTQNTCGIIGRVMYCWGTGFVVSPTALSLPDAWTSVDSQTASLRFPSLMCGVNGTLANCWSQDSNFPGTLAGNWDTIATGTNHQCGLLGTTVQCAGENAQGQLGNGKFDIGSPIPAPELTGQAWLRVDAGNAATCAITTSKTLACWGRGELLGAGQRGDSDRALPVGVDAWLEVSVGDHHACAINSGGALYCWGDSITGERGDGRGGSDQPVRVVPAE